jgi:acetyltransferase-like isoleucine patch superfamily enzyme
VSLKQRLLAVWSRLFAPRMVYGWRAADGTRLAHTRVSTHCHIEAPQRLAIGDHVFVGHFNYLDASGGLVIGEGCQITNHVSVLTHSTHVALRLMGRSFYDAADPAGVVRASTAIGAYSFIGPNSVIAPGATIGRGVLVRAFSYVDGQVPDFAIVGGQPARVLGDTRELDARWLDADPSLRAHYAAWAVALPAPQRV